MTTTKSLFPLLLACLATALPSQGPNLAPPTTPADLPVFGVAAGTQRHAAMAAGATSSLLVFEDTRAGDSDIFGLRVDANGTPIDAVPFPITKAPGNQTAPKVVWNGQDWLVAYLSEHDPGSGYFATRIEAMRVSGQGSVLGTAPFTIGGDSQGGLFAVASDGSGWIVAWTGFSAGNTDIRVRRITGAGALLDPGGVVVQPGSFSIYFQLSAAFAGGNYLVTWDENGLRGRRFSPTLTPVDPASTAIPAGLGDVRGNGAHFLFSWIQQTPQFTQQVVTRRVGANLTALDASPLGLSDPALTPFPASVHGAWNGTQWVVAWTQAASDSRASRVTATGTVLDAGGLVLPNPNASILYTPALGGLPGGGAMLLWHQARYGTADDVFGIPIDALGQVAAERVLSTGAEALRTPRTTATADGYLVTAMAELSTGSRIVAFRFDAQGNSLDPSPIEVATANHALLQVGGSGWNGTHHFVVWADGQIGQVRGRRMNPDGTWFDPAPIAVMPGFDPDVAANGADFLVTCLRYPSFPQSVYSYGARVRGSDGMVLDTPPVLIGTSYARRARVVELGGRWLVATQSHSGQLQTSGGISLHFVDTNGVVTSAPAAMAVLIMQTTGIVDLASSGTSALVVAQSGSNWTNTEIYALRVLPDGTSPVPMSIVTGANGGGQFRPSVAWNGREYVVAYETYQNNVWAYDFEPDVYGLRIAENGVPIDTAGHPFWNGEDHEVHVGGDGIGNGRALYAASVFDGALGAMRLQARTERPLGLTTFGTGTPGCAGAHDIDTNLPPIAGEAGFVVTCNHGPQNGLGLMVLGTGAYAPGFDPGLGFLLHLDLAPPNYVVIVAMLSDGNGVAGVSLPLVPLSSWLGFTMVAQGLFLWPPSCQPSSSGISASPGLQIVVQP